MDLSNVNFTCMSIFHKCLANVRQKLLKGDQKFWQKSFGFIYKVAPVEEQHCNTREEQVTSETCLRRKQLAAIKIVHMASKESTTCKIATQETRSGTRTLVHQQKQK